VKAEDVLTVRTGPCVLSARFWLTVPTADVVRNVKIGHVVWPSFSKLGGRAMSRLF